MITLFKKETDVKAVRDVCLGEGFLPKGWIGRIVGITDVEGEPAIHIRGKDPKSGANEYYYYLDPADFTSELPQKGEVKLVATYFTGKGDIWGEEPAF